MKNAKSFKYLKLDFYAKMRLSLILLLFFLLQVNANSYSQKTRISIDVSNTTIEDVLLNEIQQRTEFKFFYENNLEDLSKRVTLRINNKLIDKVLQSLLENTNITYEVLNKQIILTKKAVNEVKPPQAVSQPNPSPQLSVSGTVLDKDGTPIPGVNILEKGTTNGTSTDFDGNYSIAVADQNAVLVFSYLGFGTQEVPLSGRTEISITMEEDQTSLDEVVIIGYGSVKKSDLTGAVSSVKSEELSAFPAQDAVQALQGRAAGVQIQATNGEPGADFRIRIRGASSISANSSPLIVVDGFIGGVFPAPEDIESVEVLKDASATAIYGSRGANGVVIVTTKKGTTGKPQINFNAAYSIQNMIEEQDVLNAQQYVALQQELTGDNSFIGGGANTRWIDEVTKAGGLENYQLSVGGGSDAVKYYLSGTYFNQDGVINTSNFKRYSLTANINAKLSKRLSVGLNLITRHNDRTGVRTQEGGGNSQGAGIIMGSNLFDPSLPILNEDGSFSTVVPLDNPVAEIAGRAVENQGHVTQTNLTAKYDIFDWLTLNSSLGTSVDNQRSSSFNSAFLLSSAGQARGSTTEQLSTSVLTEHFLSFNKSFSNHELGLMGGYSYQSFRNELFGGGGRDFINERGVWWDLDSSNPENQFVFSDLTENVIKSYFARINYSFDDRYLLTFTGRYDGSSVLSDGNKWDFFPSGAFAWNIGREEFLENNKVLTDLKFRTSYGLTGNQAINPYQTLARFGTNVAVLNGTQVNTLQPTSVANTSLGWERTAQFNVGLDFEFFANRLNFSVDYYDKQTTDLLFETALPAYSGFSSQIQNIGEVSNKGFEITLSSRNISTPEFQWTSTLNFSTNRVRVEKLPNDGADIFVTTRPSHLTEINNNYILREGEPVGSFYGFVYEGVIQSEDQFLEGGDAVIGGERFADLNDDGILDENDRAIIGDPNPDATWGFTNDFKYKNFDLNIFILAVQGNDLFNITRLEMETLGRDERNSTSAAANRWTTENTGSNFPRALIGRPFRPSSRWIEDGSFIRLKNIALGYTLPETVLEKINIRSLRLFFSAQNLFTITNYSGIDPEVSYASAGTGQASNINLGLDYGSFPNVRSYTLGLQLGF